MDAIIAELFADPQVYGLDFSRPWAPATQEYVYACYLLSTQGSCYAHGKTPQEALANAIVGAEKQRQHE